MTEKADRKFIDEIGRGIRASVARAISMVENEHPRATAILESLYPSTGRAYRVGITGGTGSGKSTLIDALTAVYRSTGRTVGVVAEDPTSPFSGGAVLEDPARGLHPTESLDDRRRVDELVRRAPRVRGILRGLQPVDDGLDVERRRSDGRLASREGWGAGRRSGSPG